MPLLVYIRDVRHVLPILTQVLLFATPVAYGMDRIPASWRAPYAVLNPMATIIDSYRRAVLYGLGPDWSYFGLSAAVSVMLLVGGYLFFKRVETGFADVS